MTHTQKTYSPIDGSLYVERELAGIQEVHDALALAEKAQLAWKKIPLAERKKLCSKAVEAFVNNKAHRKDHNPLMAMIFLTKIVSDAP